ncbi:MAG: glucokinase [Pseudolabrys sp.]|nr:glucokinase [Pseudolabrys sp.]
MVAISSPIGLIGDIGATNSRLALVAPGGSIEQIRVFASDEFASLGDMIQTYFESPARARRPRHAILAVAAPVDGDQVAFTNLPWTFSVAELRRRFGFSSIRVVNDFVANALAIPHLAEGDRAQIGRGAPVQAQPVGVIGPGSGLGVSALIPTADGYVPLQSEGGHVTMAATDGREAAVLELMRKRFDHVSAERVLSGPGLINLYAALCELDGQRQEQLTAAQITDSRVGEAHPHAREATEMFCAMLGGVAGDLALTLGARGGIYIAGGIVPRLRATFAQSAFRDRFEAKGRFRGYMEAIPTYVITRPMPALLGLARMLDAS